MSKHRARACLFTPAAVSCTCHTSKRAHNGPALLPYLPFRILLVTESNLTLTLSCHHKVNFNLARESQHLTAITATPPPPSQQIVEQVSGNNPT